MSPSTPSTIDQYPLLGGMGWVGDGWACTDYSMAQAGCKRTLFALEWFHLACLGLSLGGVGGPHTPWFY